MRGKKTSYYDGGHRVPFYIRWPEKGVEGGWDIKELTHSTDLFPTLVEMCDLKKSEPIQFDGLDLSGLIFGRENKLPDRMKVITYRELNREKSAVLWNKWRLVNYTELYDIEKDPAQKSNIAEQHYKIVNAMQGYYDKWQQEVAEIDKQVDLIHIGVEQEPETFLCSANWTGDYADSWRNIYDNPKLMGYYSLQIESTGKYEISLYRWPKESGLALTDDFYNINIKHSAIYNSPDKDNPARLAALPVSKARLIVDEKQLEKPAEPNATHVTFEINLQKGQIINLEPMLLNKQGEELCGAYFTYVRKI
jgi:arylsulfatase